MEPERIKPAGPGPAIPMTHDLRRLFLHSFVLAQARMPFISGKKAVKQAIEAYEAIENYCRR
jgi:hypothetical protein